MKHLLTLLLFISTSVMAKTSNFAAPDFAAIIIGLLAIVAIPVIYQANKKNEMDEGYVIFFGIMLALGCLWAIPSTISIFFKTHWGWALSAAVIGWVLIDNLKGK